MRQTKGTYQGSLRRTWYHKRAKRRCARTRGALESRGHWAVTATVTTSSVSVQGSSHCHGGLNLCRMSWRGFGTGAWGGTVWNNWSGWSRGGVTSDH